MCLPLITVEVVNGRLFSAKFAFFFLLVVTTYFPFGCFIFCPFCIIHLFTFVFHCTSMRFATLTWPLLPTQHPKLEHIILATTTTTNNQQQQSLHSHFCPSILNVHSKWQRIKNSFHSDTSDYPISSYIQTRTAVEKIKKGVVERRCVEGVTVVVFLFYRFSLSRVLLFILISGDILNPCVPLNRLHTTLTLLFPTPNFVFPLSLSSLSTCQPFSPSVFVSHERSTQIWGHLWASF